jgi:hypothetical protein
MQRRAELEAARDAAIAQAHVVLEQDRAVARARADAAIAAARQAYRDAEQRIRADWHATSPARDAHLRRRARHRLTLLAMRYDRGADLAMRDPTTPYPDAHARMVHLSAQADAIRERGSAVLAAAARLTLEAIAGGDDGALCAVLALDPAEVASLPV